MTDRFCANCGAGRREGDLFCPNCGAPFGTPEQPSALSHVCPVCGSGEEENAFCSRCGAYLGPRKAEKRHKKTKRVLLRLLAAVLALALIAGAFSYAAVGNFRRMKDWSRAVKYLAKGNYYSGIGELEKFDTPAAEAVLKAARRSAYRKGVRAYRAGRYGEAEQLFRVCGDVEDSERYRILAASHISDYYYNDSTCARMVDGICDMWDFEDAPEGLVYNDFISRYWLSGRWETEDGKHYFEMSGDRLRYNLPNDVFGDTFRIRNGYLLLYFKDSGEEGGKVFRFYPMDRDSVSIYCIKDKQYYNLYRSESG